MPTEVAVPIEVAGDEPLGFGAVHWLAKKILNGSGELDHHQRRKPYAVGPVTRLDGRSLHSVPIRLLDDTQVATVEAGYRAMAGQRVRMGNREGVVGPAEMARLQVADEVPWLQLFAEAQPASAWEVTFHTPCFRQQGRGPCLPFPLPGVVVDSLRSAWMVHRMPDASPTAGLGALASPVDLDGVPTASLDRSASASASADCRGPELPELKVAEFDGRTEQGWAVSRQWTGFVGTVRYEIEGRASETDRLRVDRLMRLARFSGLGKMTAYGFGAVTVNHLGP